MTFSLQISVVMSSQITQAQLSNRHVLAHVLGTSVLIFSSCALFTVYRNRII